MGFLVDMTCENSYGQKDQKTGSVSIFWYHFRRRPASCEGVYPSCLTDIRVEIKLWVTALALWVVCVIEQGAWGSGRF